MIFARTYKRELTVLTLAVFLVLLAIICTTLIVRFLGMAASGRLATEAVLITLGFATLRYLPILLSLSMFIAILVALTRAHRDHEVEVWQSSGISVSDWIRPTLGFASPILLLIAILSFSLSPWAVRKSDAYRQKLMSQEETAAIAPGVFKESKQADRVFFIENFSGDNGSATNIFVQSEKNGKIRLVSSNQGYLSKDELGNRILVLTNGRQYEGLPGSNVYRIVEFERYSVLVPPKDESLSASPIQGMRTQELIRDMNNDKHAELAWRLGSPVGALLLVMLAVPLSFVKPRAGRSLNLVLAILIYMVYSNMLSVVQAWIAQGKVHPLIGLWPVHLVLGLLIFILLAARSGRLHQWRMGA
ncbi:lipopolysaccharide export system permease protein [Chitinivorax tropicus]|uniref:Lipopolysaccharide export system permease protein LptF n=1 Tax=Chitinivorax tropicus TaxID=714531 RepID=A0A840MMN5_9PROT|nr:LPS export ABC transporter permease LptF [Chitinivorax tropicus]MBB5018379.1 lipopolysaccharide export system permease protein [Chitinivorax tropicus]